MEKKRIEESKNPLISIVIPVYNVEKYLERCLDSVIRQTYRNLEIILVDDGSTDSSGEICEKYALKDKRIKVIHKQNAGLSSARNTGTKIMTGEYFTFIDSDDYVRLDYISRMYSVMMFDKSDIVICSFKKVLEDEDYSVITEVKGEHFLFNQEEIKAKMLSRKVPMYAHGKLYRTDLASKMEFPEGRLYEDVPTIWNIIRYVKRVSYIKDRMYYYRQRADSIANADFRPERMDQVYFIEDILGEFNESNELYYMAVSLCFFSVADNYALVTEEFQEEKLYLEKGIKKYKKGVLKDSTASKTIKIMAIAAYVSLDLVRIMGKAYKRYNYFKWKNKR